MPRAPRRTSARSHKTTPQLAVQPAALERLEERKLLDGDGSSRNADDHANWTEWDQATVITTDSLGFGSDTGEIEVQGDTDLFSFTAARSGLAQLRLVTGDTFDGKLWVYDADHGFMKVKNQRGPGGDETLEVQVTGGQQYFVMVDGWRVPGGHYTIEINGVDDHVDYGVWSAASAIPLDSLGFGGHPGVIEANGDSDLFFFLATRAGTAQIRLDVSDALDGRVWVYNNQREFMKVRNANGTGGDERIEVPVQEGLKYFILIDGQRDPNGGFMLRVESVDDHADYGRWSDATAVSLDSRGAASDSGAVEAAGDSDLFSFQATRSGTATLSLDVASGFDGRIWVYDGDHLFMKVRNSGAGGSDESLQVSVEEGQTYFVLVDGWRTPSGGYTVAIAIDDSDAGQWAAATTVSLNGNGDGNRAGALEVAHDTDLFRFVAPTNGTIQITLDALPGFDGWLEIYDANHNLLQPRRNTRGPGGDESLSFSASDGQTYFILVGGWRNPNGEYNLLVNA